jgi:hypothetical protein
MVRDDSQETVMSRYEAAKPAYLTISAAAETLHAERDAWLNPSGVPESKLKKRTLTNLYNALQVFRASPPNPLVC